MSENTTVSPESKEKFAVICKLVWSQLDENRDGWISTKELVEVLLHNYPDMEPRKASQIAQDFVKFFDANSDNQLSKEEFTLAVRSISNSVAPSMEHKSKYLGYLDVATAVRLSCLKMGLKMLLKKNRVHYPPTNDWCMQMMAKEWSSNIELNEHWNYVVSVVPKTAVGRSYPCWKGGVDIRDEGHEGFSLNDFCNLDLPKKANLTIAEVCGLRLYTGPGYEPINKALRMGHGDAFPVTQYAIDSALGKLAQITPPVKLFRGLNGELDPEWIKNYMSEGVKSEADHISISDPGFVSTTDDIMVATGPTFGGSLMFEVQSGIGDGKYLHHGGSVTWVSQYPAESEILLPSYCLLVPTPPEERKHSKRLNSQGKLCVYEFKIQYPWDFQSNCPLILSDSEITQELERVRIQLTTKIQSQESVEEEKPSTDAPWWTAFSQQPDELQNTFSNMNLLQKQQLEESQKLAAVQLAELQKSNAEMFSMMQANQKVLQEQTQIQLRESRKMQEILHKQCLEHAKIQMVELAKVQEEMRKQNEEMMKETQKMAKQQQAELAKTQVEMQKQNAEMMKETQKMAKQQQAELAKTQAEMKKQNEQMMRESQMQQQELQKQLSQQGFGGFGGGFGGFGGGAGFHSPGSAPGFGGGYGSQQYGGGYSSNPYTQTAPSYGQPSHAPAAGFGGLGGLMGMGMSAMGAMGGMFGNTGFPPQEQPQYPHQQYQQPQSQQSQPQHQASSRPGQNRTSSFKQSSASPYGSHNMNNALAMSGLGSILSGFSPASSPTTHTSREIPSEEADEDSTTSSTPYSQPAAPAQATPQGFRATMAQSLPGALSGMSSLASGMFGKLGGGVPPSDANTGEQDSNENQASGRTGSFFQRPGRRFF